MTLSRVLEPEVMDSAEEALDYDSMDHSEVNRKFVAELLEAGLTGPDVLDLGTGTALIPIELCRHHESCRVLAVDMSVSMLDLARRNIEVAGLTSRIQLGKIDAKRLAYADQTFHVVMSNSIVHHIPDPATVLAEALRVTAPGGRLYFRDLLRPADAVTVARLVEQHAGEANAHQRQMFADSLRAALSLEEIRELVTGLGFAAQSVQATSDRHWTWNATRSVDKVRGML